LEENEFKDFTREDLITTIKNMVEGGVSINFSGKKTAKEIDKKVKPRVTKIVKKLSFGKEEEKMKNLIIEGENLQAMVTLYKYRGTVDLILTDPPYNTGREFRYNDKWDSDPNDPDLGMLITLEDGSKHTKWMKFMYARLNMMKAMLKPSGIIAICIDDKELYNLGKMMDEIFDEENRLGIINWQKNTKDKDTDHMSTSTEYVLVYSNDKERAKTNLIERSERINSKYKNPDNDPKGNWTGGDLTAPRTTKKDTYAIQSPFTGALHYPGARAWSNNKISMKKWMNEWGTEYIEMDIKDGHSKAIVIKGAPIPEIINKIENVRNNPVIEDSEVSLNEIIVNSRKKAEEKIKSEIWPTLHFTNSGYGRPTVKKYLNQVKQGQVPMTFWANEDYDEPFELNSQSWKFDESGGSATGVKELDYMIGKGHNFQTVKPLKLIKKIIQLWCPPEGLVLDIFAGSGTTGQAVLELNRDNEMMKRNFILVEQGSPGNGDKYAKTLTRERIKRTITGERIDQKTGELKSCEKPCDSGFMFLQLMEQIDVKTLNEMKKDELIDLVLTSHFEENKKTNLITNNNENKYLVAKNEQNEGYFIIFDENKKISSLDANIYKEILKEIKKENLNENKIHVYARYELYQAQNIVFYKIPEKVLYNLGYNESKDSFNRKGRE
jgi:adenine-specific DNA-methyltransferase